MAGGKQSPRQKMINLMYLVFLAMLAMQMDKKVLSSFGFMKEKIEDANIVATANNTASLQGLATKASEQPEKFGELNDKAKQISEASTALYDYLAGLKDKMTADVSEEDKTNYESQKSPDKVDELLFAGDKFTPEGDKFVAEINNYSAKLKEVLGDKASAEILKNIDKRFNTNPDKSAEGQDIPWLKSRYEGMPLITSVANVSQIQGDIKTTESEIYSALVGGQLESDVSLKNYTGIVALDKNAFYPGEKVTGSVILGRYDATLKPTKVEFNGNKDYKNFKDGRVVVDMAAGGVGDKTIKGTIFFTENGEEVPVPFESSYSVIPKPNDAVISADKMNVVYKGLSNPLTISIPGIPGNKVTASAPGLRRVKGNSYVMRPTGSGEVTIRVSGTLDGKKITSNKKFRIKDIPPAVGMVRGRYGTVKMPKSSLQKVTVAAGLPDFLFDLKLNVSSFKIKVPGQVAIPVTGTRLNARAKQAVARARRNDQVVIFDIKASVSGSNYKIKEVLPVSIQVSN
ncbi:gliding motility protein GldM [Tenacibaculum holothuriorum]|uniref:Gliding motility protein GldM n=1 Tax=Tenacibaculum holothuriorum TaxID=1635173 RepID=A0A1Y2PA89_9FLAO|nr:gliding motility protein GldM [Tenacibaculum holothuriorum]OSY87366.1 gliding motility protein GldM [Tenacibaculum holothuriorum]